MLNYKWKEYSSFHLALMSDPRDGNILNQVFQTPKGYFVKPMFSSKGKSFSIEAEHIPTEFPLEILEKIEHSFAFFLVDNFNNSPNPYIIPKDFIFFGPRQYLCNHNIAVLTKKEHYGTGYCLTCFSTLKNNPHLHNYPITHIESSNYPYIDITKYPIFKYLDMYQQRNLLMHIYALISREHPYLKSRTIVDLMDFYIRTKYKYIK